MHGWLPAILHNLAMGGGPIQSVVPPYLPALGSLARDSGRGAVARDR